MSAIEITTDMATFEGALDEEWCHICTGSKTLCGAGKPGPSTHEGDPYTDTCDGCGRLNCPDCADIAWQTEDW